MTTTYYKLSPEDIFREIIESTTKAQVVEIEGMKFYVHPHVYPSDRFRSTHFLLKNIEPFLPGARVCDMGCGIGVVGLFSMGKGAMSVVQADINPFAVKNAKANRKLHGYSSKQVRAVQSDCFSKIPKQKFDLIVFNIPFHSDPHRIEDPLEYAFHDPFFHTTRKFLSEARGYADFETKIIIAFSNKGDTAGLEAIFSGMGFRWELWRQINQDQQYDNRLYLLNV